MAKKPETLFRENIVDPFLKKLKHTFAMSIQQKSIRGTPDKILCVRGKLVALELKKDGEKPDPLQAWTLGEIKRTGGIVLVARPDNWDEISQVLLKLDQGPK